MSDVADFFGGLDILVNNAKVSSATAIDVEDYSEQWDHCLVDVMALTHTIRAALPYLRQSDSPRIINIASTEGLSATAGHSPYTAAKHGVIGLTRASLSSSAAPESP